MMAEGNHTIKFAVLAAAMLTAAVAFGEKSERGVYFATHFGNWYENASDAEVAEYIRELKYWGANGVGAWFDMHDFSGVDDPRAAKRLARIKLIFRTALELGMGRDLLFLANEAFADSPEEMRAEWRSGQNGYERELVGHYHVELCPSKPGATELLLRWRREVFAAFADTPLTSVTIFPYDQGGCTCAKCSPWGSTVYLDLAERLAALARETFPDIRVNLSAWRFDAFGKLGEWDGFFAASERVKGFADRIYVDGGDLRRMDERPFLPYYSMCEISMWDMTPWGGFGANPMPIRLQAELDSHPGAAGARPYSEGVFEDLNKVMALAVLSGRCTNTVQAAGEYAARYFGEMARSAVEEAAVLMERNLGHDLNNDRFNAWRLDRERAERVLSILSEVEPKLVAGAAKSWRWRLLKLRAEIDVALLDAREARVDAMDNAHVAAMKPLFDEIAALAHSDESTLPVYLKPPMR